MQQRAAFVQVFVAVLDSATTTPHAVGDRISVSVSRSEISGQRRLGLLLFNFPKSPKPASVELVHAASQSGRGPVSPQAF